MTKEFYDPFAFTKALLPTTIGFDDMFKKLENVHRSVTKMTNSYPPYNVKKIDENRYVIEVAVAGFGKQDIEVEMVDGTLSIKGNTTIDTLTKDGVDVTYLHHGIAERAFTRSFKLADTIEIKNAELINGILKVWLENIIPESKKPRKIDIKDETSAPVAKEQSSTQQFLTEKYDK
jgi:molecular chaperone IbpA